MKTKFLSKIIPLCILIILIGFQLLPASHALAIGKQSILSNSNPNNITVSASIDADNWFDNISRWFDSVTDDFQETGEKIKRKFESIKNSISSLFSSVDDGVDTFSSDGGNEEQKADEINESIDNTFEELKNSGNGNDEGPDNRDPKDGHHFISLTRDEARAEVQQLLINGEVRLEDLRSIIPEGIENTFLPSDRIKEGEKYEFSLVDGQKVIIRWHSPDTKAKELYPESSSGTRWTAQIKIGNKSLGSDGKWYKNQSINAVHIPIKGR